MKKSLFLLSFFVASQAFANGDADNFSGPQVALGGGFTSSISKLTVPPTENSKFGDTSFVAVVDGGYLKSINDKFLIGIGATYDLNRQSNAGSRADDASSSVPRQGFVAKYSQHYSAYLQPTYAINDKVAVFAKVGYHSIKLDVGDPTSNYYGAFTIKKRVDGIGAGVGFMAFLSKNIFTKLELQFVKYQSTNVRVGNSSQYKYELSTTSGIASIGYRF